MFKNKSNIIKTLLKGITGILACSFLAYSLLTFDGYDSLLLPFREGGISHWYLLLLVILMIPFNWLLESVKWKILIEGVERISLKRSLYSVLAGLTTGVFSPGRVGEFIGRVLLLEPQSRRKASALWAVGAVTTTIVICLIGVPALFLFVKSGKEIDLLQNFSVTYYLLIALSSVLFLILLYFMIPHIGNFLSRRFSGYFSSFFDMLKKIALLRLMNILVVSLLRYMVFCLQFWIMLGFFGVELSAGEACIGIFTSYLFITFLPSVFLTEATVKSSVFVLVLSAFSGNSVAIIGASMLLWILNLAIPTLFGVLFLTKNMTK